MPVKPTPMKEVKRMNTVVARNFLQGQEGKEGGMKRDSYVMNIDCCRLETLELVPRLNLIPG